MRATAIVLTQSLDYVDAVFAAARDRRTLVGVTSSDSIQALPGIEVDGCIEPAVRFGWHAVRQEPIEEDAPAQVVFTSGTEGQPKAIVLSYANQADATRRLVRAQALTGEVREYVGVPVTYSFGMGRFRAIAAVGGSAYLPPRGFDPLELARMLRNGEVNALSAVPTLLRLLLAEPDIFGNAGTKLRWLEIGSQYLSADEKRRVRALFPQARIIQHYGLTEASRSTFLDVSAADGDALESVGRAEPPVEIGFDGHGRIRIRGPHVARWRIDARGLHALCDAEGWLQTNDLGHVKDGCLFFDGRADDLINCGGVKIVPDLLEERIRERLGAGARIAVARVRDESRGETVLVATEVDEASLPGLREVAAGALGEMGVGAAGNLHVRRVASIPVTATGKPLRRELSASFTPEVHSATTPKDRPVRTVRELFESTFPGARITPQDSFESLGGDSLRYIRFSMEFERRFGFSPAQWEALSVERLQQLVDGRRAAGSVASTWRLLDSSTLMRAIAIFFIVGRHTESFSYSRNFGAGVLLFALGGYTLARFQLPEVLRKGSVRVILGTAVMVAIPTLLVTVPTQVMTHTFEPMQYLLLSNFLDPTAPSRASGVPFYFAEIYFQLFVLAALLFSFGGVRRLFTRHPFPAAVGLFFALLGGKYLIGLAWDTDYLFQRVPQYYGWTFALGMVVALARTPVEKAVGLGLIALSVLPRWGLEWSSLLMGGGLALVLFVPALRVPAWVKSVVGEVAAASIFIYLIHFQMISVVRRVLGPGMHWVTLAVTLVVGIIVAYGYGWLQRKVARTPPGRRFFGWLSG
jgi:acyl carrier protein/peptidoglycan/LPS O-acetylase OafA/YrhL